MNVIVTIETIVVELPATQSPAELLGLIKFPDGVPALRPGKGGILRMYVFTGPDVPDENGSIVTMTFMAMTMTATGVLTRNPIKRIPRIPPRSYSHAGNCLDVVEPIRK
jgi:hypothetical protein